MASAPEWMETHIRAVDAEIARIEALSASPDFTARTPPKPASSTPPSPREGKSRQALRTVGRVGSNQGYGGTILSSWRL